MSFLPHKYPLRNTAVDKKVIYEGGGNFLKNVSERLFTK